ncbi:MAG: TonB-dependent receptor [Pseudomonadota bacterium]
MTVKYPKIFFLLTSLTAAPWLSAAEIDDNENPDNISLAAVKNSGEDEKNRYSPEVVVVQGYRSNPLGKTLSASEGVVGSEEISNRPLLRTGEILEFVPGMVVTQHSGSGKANQYFLRGFNLDHGTDFNSSIDGMPINMRTHGHGQGYTDLNFIIPEFINNIDYRKGPYYAEISDFSGAGAALFSLKNSMDENLLSLTLGQDNYVRLLAAGGISLTNGKLLLGVETQKYDGPWSMVNEDVEKNSFMGRYVSSISDGDFALTLMAYDNSWGAADQIPERAVKQQIIDRLGSLDTSVGGSSSRYSLSSSWNSADWMTNIYAVKSSMDIFSNFTYFLDDPINGDQFEQVDERSIFGGALKHKWAADFSGKTITHELGAEFRYDKIDKVGLYHTVERQRLGTTRQDAVDEASLGIFAQSTIELSEKLNTHIGLRYDYYNVDVDSNIEANSGDATDGKVSIKAGATYQFSDRVEGYINAGQGFHSNDARGATITQDPVSGEPSDSVDLIVPSTGAEIGVKIFDEQRFNISTSLWYLRSDSELLFVGDAGNTEPSRASTRYGTEIAGYYWLTNVWNFDMEFARTISTYNEDRNTEGKYVEGSVPVVASAGITYGAQGTGLHGSLRYRYFGARKLDSFNEQKVGSTTIVNLGVGYRWRHTSIELDILNLLDSKDHDIDYAYASRLDAEPPEGIEEVHYHPVEPRTLRMKIDYRF